MSASAVLIGFAAMIAMLLLSFPVAVIMVVTGVIGGVLIFGWPLVMSMGPVSWGVLNENILTAVPLFILLGELLLRSGLADKMYTALAVWFVRLPGGLLHTNIGASAMFAATSGSSVATAATIGTVSLPNLTKRGYSPSRSLGSLAAGGTLGILIPPSVNLLIYGSMAEVSIGQLFIAGIVPGVLLTLCFMAYIAIHSIISPDPAERDARETLLPIKERLKLAVHLIPPMMIFLVVMGSIYLGIATPTESAALAVVAALIFIAFSGRLTFALLDVSFRQSAKTTGMILLIVVAAFMLNVTLALGGAAQAMTTWVASFGLSATSLLLVLIVFYLVLGMFMDVLSMQVLTIPIALPVITAAGIDPVWFGIFVVLMCELGMITPPVGMNLYVVQGVRTDRGPFGDVVKGAIPYAVIMILFTIFLIMVPEVVLWLPAEVR
ncbi:TRAP transporter large permease [Acuticoccus yangtzensis]|uniref:TRAP transporter large permease n=1 Tax=Acuticoccus yangtzensis TaxID=1443441 RepID=UPI000949696A|nr:TRAP transporter large permease [Acuticoccus yangtzensis]ORE96181.1 TRAP dicarboxylate transporter subunit DctM [Stappia sp. 22II-S9-Z10]